MRTDFPSDVADRGGVTVAAMNLANFIGSASVVFSGSTLPHKGKYTLTGRRHPTGRGYPRSKIANFQRGVTL